MTQNDMWTTAATLLRRVLAGAVPRLPAMLRDRYRPEMHYMRGPGPKTLSMIGRRLRAETRGITEEPLPEGWLKLVRALDERERARSEQAEPAQPARSQR
jgi:hypothetical protein